MYFEVKKKKKVDKITDIQIYVYILIIIIFIQKGIVVILMNVLKTIIKFYIQYNL